MKVHQNAIAAREAAGRWLATGWAIAVFENHDLGSMNVGHRFALPFDQADVAKMEIGKSRAPDGPYGMGWRYLLVAKPATADELIDAMRFERKAA